MESYTPELHSSGSQRTQSTLDLRNQTVGRELINFCLDKINYYMSYRNEHKMKHAL